MSVANPHVQTNSNRLCLLGAVAGDVIGSVYEFSRQKKYSFPLFTGRSKFTDDSVLTLAVAEAILRKRSYLDAIREFAKAYPDSGYGGYFQKWMYSKHPAPYNSFGNGSAMRVSAVAWAFTSMEDVLAEAEQSAAVTHNHLEGIKGAQATACAIFLARKGETKERIKQDIVSRFSYDLERTLNQIRPTYEFNEICQETVPEAIIAFLESENYEDAIRKAISLGGDADTLAAITGGIAGAYYGGVPDVIGVEVRKRMPDKLWKVIEEFGMTYAVQT